MPRFKDYRPAGVIPATLLPFDDDFSIDWQAMGGHLRDVAAVDGISAITVNGHASEIHACEFDEQRRILAASLEAVGDRLPLINGVYADGSLEAAKIARMSEDEGASALLVFPPHSIGRGNGRSRPEMALAHFRQIADATDLPFIIFQYAAGSGYDHALETLLRLADEIPGFVAIKDASGNPPRHELHIRTLQGLARPVNVLSTHSAWLMSSLAMGCAGLLSGSGSVIADLQVALFQAIQANDLVKARRINDRIHPTARVFYADPACDMHNRMKEALVLLGRLPSAVVRPPLVKISDEEIGRIGDAIAEARIGREGALPAAA